MLVTALGVNLTGSQAMIQEVNSFRIVTVDNDVMPGLLVLDTPSTSERTAQKSQTSTGVKFIHLLEPMETAWLITDAT